MVFPAASISVTQAAGAWLYFFMPSTASAMPTASHTSNGPKSQPKPARMASSIRYNSSAISGIRSETYSNKPKKDALNNSPALSFPAAKTFMRSFTFSMVLVISNVADLTFCCGLYSSVFKSSAKISVLPSADLVFL